MRDFIAETRERSLAELLRGAWRALGRAFTQRRGTKAMALVLTMLIFAVTRDEVQKTYTIPVRVIQDPDRVLLSTLPPSVDVELRGAWTELSRLGSHALGEVVIDLQKAEAGPLQIDARSVTVPPGVALVATSYSPVDLRFDPVVERWVELRAVVEGEVDPDFERYRVVVDPKQWKIRGAGRVIQGIETLSLEAVDVEGATKDIERRVGVTRPPEAVSFLGALEGGMPRVMVRVEVHPLAGESSLVVPVLKALRAAVPPSHDADELEMPATETVIARGPRPLLRRIEAIEAPIDPEVTVLPVEPAEKGERPSLRMEIRFRWAQEIDEATRAALTVEPAVVRLSI